VVSYNYENYDIEKSVVLKTKSANFITGLFFKDGTELTDGEIKEHLSMKVLDRALKDSKIFFLNEQ
jgi:hypothetical protein